MNSPGSEQSKTQLRRSLLQARQALPEVEWRYKSQQLCHQLQQTPWFQQARTILAFFSFRQEPDLSPLFQDQPQARRWGFPRCEADRLVWHAWSATQGDRWQISRYGIREPDPALPRLSAAEVDLLLVPAVACDQRGYRLGYGGGYFDRLLRQPEWQILPTIGIVFEAARLEQLPIDPWDLPLEAVCTETGLFLGTSARPESLLQ